MRFRVTNTLVETKIIDKLIFQFSTFFERLEMDFIIVLKMIYFFLTKPIASKRLKAVLN